MLVFVCYVSAILMLILSPSLDILLHDHISFRVGLDMFFVIHSFFYLMVQPCTPLSHF